MHSLRCWAFLMRAKIWLVNGRILLGRVQSPSATDQGSQQLSFGELFRRPRAANSAWCDAWSGHWLERLVPIKQVPKEELQCHIW